MGDHLMGSRFQTLQAAEKKKKFAPLQNGNGFNSKSFGTRTFSKTLMRQMLPKEVFKNLSNAMEGIEKIKSEYADTIAVAVKEWAISQGATHYCHWFQPLTGASAEKHDAFIDWDTPDSVIEKFNGKQLIQGEPDASSFPSGGLRSTYEARGYTGWDPTSPLFLWKAGDGVTLCIPSVFFSWTGDVLDTKIPLLRSNYQLNQAILRLLNLTGISADYVYSTLGLEQEYFVIDSCLRNLRSDLVLLGKTVFGAASPKGQELQDHYFGAVKDRILSFMRAFETAAIELGIPVKTRHNEVAPAQHEIAPVFERASAAIDHNILLMEIMRQVARDQDLVCLLHEKPFGGINGSGKHANWSISTNTGINLLDPSDTPHNNWHFLILLTAILNGVYRHAMLLRASIGSASNDYRLGGHEAPPAIISVYLGQEIEKLLESIEQQSEFLSTKQAKFNLGSLVIPDVSKDNTDRNRTSPFAFTGNKFEFRAVGSSANPSLPITVLNLLVAESLHEILNEIETRQANKPFSVEITLSVLQKYLKASKNIRFSGDNYSKAWVEEANKRGLPNLKKSPEAFSALTVPQTIKLFENVLNEQELASRQEILYEHYVLNMNIEVNLMLDIFKTQILPAALNNQQALAQGYAQVKEVLGLDPSQADRQLIYLRSLYELIEETMGKAAELERAREESLSLSLKDKSMHYSYQVLDKMEQLRAAVDRLECIVNDELWPIPKYRELLFLI